MSRENKYRAWDNVRNKMWEWNMVSRDVDLGNILSGKSNLKPLQFTGLKDKNGVEIYEGDIISYTILRFNGVGYETKEEYGVVEYGDAVFAIDGVPLYVAHAEDDEIEVIGNILEDGDLLDS